MAAAGFHQLGSPFADAQVARVRDKLARGETVYLAGLGPPGTHNSGIALVEVTQQSGPRLIDRHAEACVRIVRDHGFGVNHVMAVDGVAHGVGSGRGRGRDNKRQ